MLSNDDFEASAALEVAITLAAPFLLSMPRIGLTFQRTDSERWKDFYQSFFDDHPGRARSLSKIFFQLCYTGVSDGKISIEDLVKWHGPKALFQSRPYTMAQVRMVPLAEQYVGFLHGSLSSTLNRAFDKGQAYRNLRSIGSLALSSPMPWIEDRESIDPFLGYILGDHRQKSSRREDSTDLEADTLFGVFVSIATVLELEAGHAHPSAEALLETLRNDHMSLFGHLHRVLASRFDVIDQQEVEQELHRSGFSVDQRTFIWRWTTGDMNLVLPSNSEQDTQALVDGS
jgi:hypothetical protein